MTASPDTWTCVTAAFILLAVALLFVLAHTILQQGFTGVILLLIARRQAFADAARAARRKYQRVWPLYQQMAMDAAKEPNHAPNGYSAE